jgi:hypothetical protein
MLNAKMLSVDILRVVISYAGCHYAEYHCTDCHYSESINANCNYVKCRYTECYWTDVVAPIFIFISELIDCLQKVEVNDPWSRSIDSFLFKNNSSEINFYNYERIQNTSFYL